MNTLNMIRDTNANAILLRAVHIALCAAAASGQLVGRLRSFLTTETSHAIPQSASTVTGGSRDAVLVIDASPSMEETDWKPSRLEGAKQSARAYVTRLSNEEPDARVAIVAYSLRARTLCELTSVRGIDGILQAIDRITVNDWTNITAGLRTAFRILEGVGRTGHVVLLTDGVHNKGPDPTSIATRLRAVAVLETVGIGGKRTDVNEDLLKSIASAYPDGRKRYRWIGDKEALVRHFHKLAGRITRE